jgi:pimeloyl-ACP methyl ester carboxylesterase
MAKNLLNALLLRGLVREQRHWGNFLSKWQENLPMISAHCLDHPGVGTEFSRSSPYSIAEITDDIRNRWLILKEKHKEPWILFSISLGAMVGMDWVARYPDDFCHLTIINTSVANLSWPWERFYLDKLKVLIYLSREKDPIKKERAILDMVSLKAENKDELARLWAGYALKPHKLRQRAIAQLWAAIKFRAPMKINIPLTVLCGEKDTMVNPVATKKIASYYGVPCHSHIEGGHDLTLDQADWVCETLLKDLKSFDLVIS